MKDQPNDLQTAYVVASQVQAAAAVRQLLAIEAADPDVGAVLVECSADGAIAITLLSLSGQPIGGYSL